MRDGRERFLPLPLAWRSECVDAVCRDDRGMFHLQAMTRLIVRLGRCPESSVLQTTRPWCRGHADVRVLP